MVDWCQTVCVRVTTEVRTTLVVNYCVNMAAAMNNNMFGLFTFFDLLNEPEEIVDAHQRVIQLVTIISMWHQGGRRDYLPKIHGKLYV